MRARVLDVTYAESASFALEDAHGAVAVTDWDEFGALGSEFDAIAGSVVVERAVTQLAGYIATRPPVSVPI